MRIVIVGSMAAAIAAFAFVAATTNGSAHGEGSRISRSAAVTRPIVVLEHGAWADASSWRRVIARLQHDGYTVYAPPDPLRGLPSDSAYLHAFLTENAALRGRPVVLVGHSYGGAVITNAAVGVPEVKALVYVDAFIPDQGQSLEELDHGSCLAGNPAALFDLVPYPGGPEGDVDTYLKRDVVRNCFATGLPAAQAAVIAATQRPLAASALSEPSGPPAWKNVPSWAVVGTADKVIPAMQQLTMAHRAGAHIIEVDAGHLSLISRARTVTRVIEAAARARVR
ncbi:MAG TPA: alpha/beta hydrolase [Solirubrobacteraceae bacterium]|nr:alpha/beta hydrolase [Solirubrobacteraceae bacterium]